MTVCKKCNGQLEDGVKFCKFCGSKIDDIDYTEYDGSVSIETPIESRNQHVGFGGNKKKVLSIISGALILVAAFAIIPRLFSGSDPSDTVFYIKDDEISYTNIKKIEPVELTEELYGMDNADEYYISDLLYHGIYMSKDGKRILYPDKIDDSYNYSLYYSNLKDKKAENQKIDSDIIHYVVNDDLTNVFYMKGTEGSLYKHDFNEKTKIGSGITNFYINSDGTKVLYVNGSGEIYLQTEGKDKEKIDSDSTIANVSDDLSKIYYIKENTLFRKEEGKDKVKIDSDVTYVELANDSDEIYYVKSNEVERKLSEFVVDDMKEQDELIDEPTKPTLSSPNRFDYGSYDEYRDAYNLYAEEYNKIRAEYLEKYDIYRMKTRRDNLRSSLDSETISYTNDTLYYYNGKESVVLTDTYAWCDTRNSDEGAMVYYQFKKPETVSVNISEVDNYYDVYELVSNSISSEKECYFVFDGKTNIIEDCNNPLFRFNETMTALYYADDIGNEGSDLYEIKISDKSLEKPVLYGEDINYFTFLGDGETIAYFTEQDENDNCDLYVNKIKMDSDVSRRRINKISSTNSFTYYTDYSEEKQYGTLKLYENNEVKKIADDVYSELPITSDKILYLTDYSLDKSKGDAYLYDGSDEKSLIDVDVASFITPVIK